MKFAPPIFLLLLLSLTTALCGQSLDLTLMYRRSGETAINYQAVASMDTLRFYQRQGNPYFRVYSFRFLDKSLIQEAEIESIKGNQVIKKANIKVRSVGTRQQLVDTFVEPEEELVRVSLEYSNADGMPKVFVFFIKPDLEQF